MKGSGAHFCNVIQRGPGVSLRLSPSPCSSRGKAELSANRVLGSAAEHPGRTLRLGGPFVWSDPLFGRRRHMARDCQCRPYDRPAVGWGHSGLENTAAQTLPRVSRRRGPAPSTMQTDWRSRRRGWEMAPRHVRPSSDDVRPPHGSDGTGWDRVDGACLLLLLRAKPGALATSLTTAP